MKTINLFGSAGAGKSTTAAGLFYEMKRHWIEAEYIQEYAKELIWADSAHMLSEQNYIFAEQEHRLNRLRKKVAIAIADSPLLLSSFYAPDAYPEAFHQSVFHFFESYNNINIFVKRSHEYSLSGRMQNSDESDYVAQEMQRFLTDNGISFWSITASDASPRRLLTWLVEEHGLQLPNGMTLEKEYGPAGWLDYHQASTVWFPERKISRANLSGIRTVG